MATAFIRRPNEVNRNVVVCCCAKCGALIGASPSYALMKIMEDLHKCTQTETAHRPKALAH